MTIKVLQDGLPIQLPISGAAIADLQQLVASKATLGSFVFIQYDPCSTIADECVLESMNATLGSPKDPATLFVSARGWAGAAGKAANLAMLPLDLCMPGISWSFRELQEAPPEVAPASLYQSREANFFAGIWGPRQMKVRIVGEGCPGRGGVDVPVFEHTSPATLKVAAERLFGIPASQQLLYVTWQAEVVGRSPFYVSPVRDSASLASLGVYPGAVIEARRKPLDPGLPVTVVSLTGKRIPLTCHPWTTAGEVKDQIRKVEGIPPDQQRLICKGLQLSDDRMLLEYGVQSGDRIHLIQRLRGGMLHITSGRRDFEELDGARTREVECVLPDGSSVSLVVRCWATIAEVKQELRRALARRQIKAQAAEAKEAERAVLTLDAEHTDDVEALRAALRQAQAALRKRRRREEEEEV